MIDYLRLPELADQFLSRTKLRFHLQVKVLRRAVDILTADFHRAEAKTARTRSASAEGSVPSASAATPVGRPKGVFETEPYG